MDPVHSGSNKFTLFLNHKTMPHALPGNQFQLLAEIVANHHTQRIIQDTFSQEQLAQMVSQEFSRVAELSQLDEDGLSDYISLINITMALSPQRPLALIRLYSFISNKFVIIDQDSGKESPAIVEIIGGFATLGAELVSKRVVQEAEVIDLVDKLIAADNFAQAAALAGLLLGLIDPELNIFAAAVFPQDKDINQDNSQLVLFSKLGENVSWSEGMRKNAFLKFRSAQSVALALMWLQILVGMLGREELARELDRCMFNDQGAMHEYSTQARIAANRFNGSFVI